MGNCTDGVFFSLPLEGCTKKSRVRLWSRCLNGYNGTVMAYGQTGTGKTFTMSGPSNVNETHKVASNTVCSYVDNPFVSPSEFLFIFSRMGNLLTSTSCLFNQQVELI